MQLLLSSITLIFIGLAVRATQSLPEDFYGTYNHHHSENFDEYLEAKGYGWFTRKLVTLASFVKIFTRGPGNTFDYALLTTKKNVSYRGIVLGKEFTGEGLDSSDHYTASQTHVPLEIEGDAKEQEYEYFFDGEFLVVRMEAKGVVGKRFYTPTTLHSDILSLTDPTPTSHTVRPTPVPGFRRQ